MFNRPLSSNRDKPEILELEELRADNATTDREMLRLRNEEDGFTDSASLKKGISDAGSADGSLPPTAKKQRNKAKTLLVNTR